MGILQVLRLEFRSSGFWKFRTFTHVSWLIFFFSWTEDPAVRTRLTECLETILNKAQEPPKSKKVQHSNAKNAVLFEAINLIIHMDSEPSLLVRACNQLGQFLQHRETNLRWGEFALSNFLGETTGLYLISGFWGLIIQRKSASKYWI